MSFEACIKYFSFFILMFLAYGSIAQCKPEEYPEKCQLPFMWSKNDPQLIKRFVSKKLPLINNHTGVLQPSSFTLRNFLGMIKYFKETYGADFQCLHVYIVAYSNEGSPYVPEDCGNLLTLLFAPAKAYVNPTTKTDLAYFNIPPETLFDPTQIAKFIIKNPDLPTEWRRNYINKIMPAMYKTIDDTEPDNYDHDNLADTKCITYCAVDLLQLLYEKEYTHTDKKTNKEIKYSPDMQVSFAAFGSKGNPRRSDIAKKRLFLQFDFLDEEGTVRYLEDTKEYDKRPKAINENCKNCVPITIKELNNGQLCPPSTNCPNN